MAYNFFFRAIREGDVHTVQALLAAGAPASPFVTDDDGWTPFMVASEHGHVDVVRALIAAYTADEDFDEYDQAFTEDHQCNTPLMLASKHGHVDIVAAFIGAGASVDKRNENGYTAIMKASDNGHADVVQALIDAGADVNQVSKRMRETPLMHASWTGDDSAATFTRKLTSEVRGRMDEVVDEHERIVDMLLDAGADVNAKSEQDYTALMHACDIGIANKLLARGADPNIGDESGMTALMWRSDCGNLHVVCRLIAAGATVNQTDRYGRTALMSASREGHCSVVGALIIAGADTTIADTDGETALIKANALAASPNKSKLVAMLNDPAGLRRRHKMDKLRTFLCRVGKIALFVRRMHDEVSARPGNAAANAAIQRLGANALAQQQPEGALGRKRDREAYEADCEAE